MEAELIVAYALIMPEHMYYSECYMDLVSIYQEY